jgi:hypothetical protein
LLEYTHTLSKRELKEQVLLFAWIISMKMGKLISLT